MFASTKTFGHELGLSAAFRQWKAQSHCHLIHGYALAIKFEFRAKDEDLDACNWVVDFGSFKSLKESIEKTFDHTLLVAKDDPKRAVIEELEVLHGLAKVIIVPATGCEAFSKLIFEYTEAWLESRGYKSRVWLHSVEVREHGANSAIYYGKDND